MRNNKDTVLLLLQAQLYAQSAFCYEEVILHQPQNAPVYVQYADVLYTLGGSYIKTARQYYAAALKLSNGENMRALYGITCTAAALATKVNIISVLTLHRILHALPSLHCYIALALNMNWKSSGGMIFGKKSMYEYVKQSQGCDISNCIK